MTFKKMDYLPIQCEEKLLQIGLLAKKRRLDQRIRQRDVTERLGVSKQTLRKIEAGDPTVSLHNFMLVVWNLGLVDEIFCVQDSGWDDLAGRRVRLPRPKESDF